MDSVPSAILLIDDEPALLNLMKAYLTRAGYAVVASNAAEQGWQTFVESPCKFAVTVVDGTLPGEGLERLATRMLAADARLCLIACSGYPVDMTALKAAAPGRVEFLQKPFSPVELIEAVRRMLAEKKEDV